jgi:two-component system nitrogen regulation response regulator GlnG
MPMQAQTRLLRALQSGSVRRVGGRDEVRLNTRIIAATNKDLQPLIAAGLFREDLYYRLNVVPITMPPLRERPDDIEALSRHFLQLATAEGLPRRQLTADAAVMLSRQAWRGNVRELKNFIYRLALLAREEVIDVESIASLLPVANDADRPLDVDPVDLDTAVGRWLRTQNPDIGTIYDTALAAFERPLFTLVLREFGGNQLRAAQALGINRNTLRKRMVDLNLDPELFARRP